MDRPLGGQHSTRYRGGMVDCAKTIWNGKDGLGNGLLHVTWIVWDAELSDDYLTAPFITKTVPPAHRY